MNLQGRQQWLAIVAIICVGFLVGDRLVLSPLLRNWKARSSRLADLRQRVQQGDLLLERENAIRSRWETMRTNLLSADPSEAERQILKAFERWSQESRIGISGIKPQWKETDENETRLECRVDAFGSLSAVTRFLYELEADQLAVKIDAVELTSRNDNGDDIALTLQVSALLAAKEDQP